MISGEYEGDFDSRSGYVSCGCSWSCDDGKGCLCEQILEISPYAVLAVDKAGVITHVNQQLSDLLGMGKNSIETKRMLDIMTLFQGEKPNDEIERLLHETGRWNGDIGVIAGDGSQRILRFKVTRVKINNSPNDYNDIYIGSDITGVIRDSRVLCQEARSSTRSELAGEISHELNNFLSISMGNLELLGMSIEKGKFDNLDKRVKSVREGLNRMAKFVEGLMSISRQEQHLEQVNLNKFLENEISFLEQESEFKGIEFIKHLDNAIPPVEVDKGRLQQAIYNILINARDAVALSVERRITVTSSLSEPDGYIRLAISDSGPGLVEDDYSKVYRQNFTTKGPGHGFGLLSVKGMIKSQGGRVAVGPGPDGGACFTLELPGTRDVAAIKLLAMPVLQ